MNFEGNELTLSKLSLVILSDLALGKLPTFGRSRTLMGMHWCIHAWSCRLFTHKMLLWVSVFTLDWSLKLCARRSLIWSHLSTKQWLFLKPKEPNKWCCCLSPTSTPTSYFKSDDYHVKELRDDQLIDASGKEATAKPHPNLIGTYYVHNTFKEILNPWLRWTTSQHYRNSCNEKNEYYVLLNKMKIWRDKELAHFLTRSCSQNGSKE